MKVLHVINGLGTGGAERSLREMLPGFRERGLDCEVAVLHRREHGVESEVLQAGVAVHDVRGSGRASQLRSLRQLVRARRPDVIHTTIFEADVLGRLAAAGSAIPVVTSLVNTPYGAAKIEDPNVSRLRLEGVRRIDSISARRWGAAFHAITHAVRDDAVEQLRIDPAKVTVIPRGRTRSRLGEPSAARRTAVRQHFGFADAEFVVLNIGRQEFQKGQSTLLEATARLRDQGFPLTTVIAGRDGNETARLRALSESLGLSSTVRFLGHVDEVPDLLAACDVFAFPSRFEGLGGSVLEALALEAPIVASDVPALREVLQGGSLGELVPVDDAAALAASIETIRSDPSAARVRSVRGREVFDDTYTFDRVTDSMAEWLAAASRALTSGVEER
jgi:glycosyltransferase involved in cell wall biosynthesis